MSCHWLVLLFTTVEGTQKSNAYPAGTLYIVQKIQYCQIYIGKFSVSSCPSIKQILRLHSRYSWCYNLSCHCNLVAGKQALKPKSIVTWSDVAQNKRHPYNSSSTMSYWACKLSTLEQTDLLWWHMLHTALHSTTASPAAYSATLHSSLTSSIQCYTPLQPHLHIVLHSTPGSPPPYSATFHSSLTSSIQCYTPLQPHLLHIVLHSTTASPPPYSATLHYCLTSSKQFYTPLQPHLFHIVLHSTTASPPPYSATLHYSLTSSIQCYTPLQPHLLHTVLHSTTASPPPYSAILH